MSSSKRKDTEKTIRQSPDNRTGGAVDNPDQAEKRDGMMDAMDQKAGEAQVRDRLIEPLLRRGLARPSSLTREGFDLMLQDLCQRLAYMTPLNLDALAEQVAANPAGKDRDRLPIGNTILEWAAQIQPPDAGASPLMRAVFRHAVGREALAQGWAPELLAQLRRDRRWPGSFALTQVRQAGLDAAQRLADIEMRLARDGEVRTDEAEFRQHRRALIARCSDIARDGGQA